VNQPPPPEPMVIATRGYVLRMAKKKKRTTRPRHTTIGDPGPSGRVLVLDTETTADSRQQLRFGVCQLREDDDLIYEALFYDPLELHDDERSKLFSFAADRGMDVLTRAEFVEDVFYPSVYDGSALCIGLNLPFDISRIAIGHGAARGEMRGGFSFQLSDNPACPRIQVHSLNSRLPLIRFAGTRKQQTPRSLRRQSKRVPTPRGYFVDLRALSDALLGGSWSLERLTERLGTATKKRGGEEHGQELTARYLEYACDDVQSTWECYVALRDLYGGYGLTHVPLYKLYSAASLGKAHLKEMGIVP
jgi:hypothetical protein